MHSSSHAAVVRHYHIVGHLCNIQAVPEYFGYIFVFCYATIV